MTSPWPELPYDAWHDTCDTLHAHTQVLGKLAVALAPPEPQLQHAALRLTARGWERPPLPAPPRPGLGAAAPASPRPVRCAGRRPRPAHPRCGCRTQRRTDPSGAAGSGPA